MYTQPYSCLNRDRFELAPHPFLTGNRDWLVELKTKRAEFPKAVGWRAHSCVFSHTLAVWLSCNGYAYVSTHDCFGLQGIRPNRHLWGVWHVPIYYMDTLDFSRVDFGRRAKRSLSLDRLSRLLSPGWLLCFRFPPNPSGAQHANPKWYMTKRGLSSPGNRSRRFAMRVVVRDPSLTILLPRCARQAARAYQ